MANLEVGTKKQLQTGTVTLQDISGNNLPDRILTKKNSKPRGREEREEREQESTKIH